jgi:hypothetical protein
MRRGQMGSSLGASLARTLRHATATGYVQDVLPAKLQKTTHGTRPTQRIVH